MALTRKFLKAMGIEDDKIDQIIDAHVETVDGLKEQITTLKGDSDKLTAVQKELDELKAAGDGDKSYKAKFEAQKAEYEAYKSQIDAEKAHGAKEAAVRKYYESKQISGKNLDIALRGTKVDDIELDGDKIKDTAAIDELIGGVYSSLVTTTGTAGAKVDTPPAGAAAAGKNYSAADIKSMTADQINANWDAIRASLKNGG